MRDVCATASLLRSFNKACTLVLAAHRARVCLGFVTLLITEGAEKVGSWPLPWPACNKKMQAAGTTGSAQDIPTFPARWCYDLYALFPGTGCLAPVVWEEAPASSQTWHQQRDARTPRHHRRPQSH